MDNCAEEGKEDRSADPRIPDFGTKGGDISPFSLLVFRFLLPVQDEIIRPLGTTRISHQPRDRLIASADVLDTTSSLVKLTDGCLPRYFGRPVINDTRVAVGSDIVRPLT